jgi:hypothetical protein
MGLHTYKGRIPSLLACPLSFPAACLVLAQHPRRNRTSPPSVKLAPAVADSLA